MTQDIDEIFCHFQKEMIVKTQKIFTLFFLIEFFGKIQ